MVSGSIKGGKGFLGLPLQVLSFDLLVANFWIKMDINGEKVMEKVIYCWANFDDFLGLWEKKRWILSFYFFIFLFSGFFIFLMKMMKNDLKMKNNMKEEDEEKKLGVGGSLLHMVDLQSNGWNHIKNIQH